MAFNVEIRGLRELQAKISSMPKEIHKEVSAVVEAGAKKWVRDAKRDAPVDVGFLKNGISYAQVISSPTKTAFEVVSNAEYSAYMEWGTITKVNIPSGEEGYASQFKGRGIKTSGGIYPRPFFFKHKEPVKLFIEKAIKSIAKAIQ